MEPTNLKVSNKNKFIASFKLDKSDFTSISIFIKNFFLVFHKFLFVVRLLRFMVYKKSKTRLNHRCMFDVF